MQTSTNSEGILFLYLPTGGGHISAARALSEQIKQSKGYENSRIYILDPMEKAPKFFRAMVEDGYSTVSVRIPFLWPPIYQISSYPFVMRPQTCLVSFLTRRYLADFIRKNNITRIVVLHFLLIRPVQAALELLSKPELPVLTVVTDPFTVHPLWAYKHSGPMCVFSQESYNRMYRRLKHYAPRNSPERRGKPDIHIVPPLIRSDFLNPLSEEENRKNRLAEGFDPDKSLILIAGGGDGLPLGEILLQALCWEIEKSKTDQVQIAMVCGKNSQQYHLVQILMKLNPNIHIKAYQFTTHMYELMNMSDLVIAKGGPATVFECLCLGKPLFISTYFYGQEQGNVDFVTRHNLGSYTSSPFKMAREALSWLGFTREYRIFKVFNRDEILKHFKQGSPLASRHLLTFYQYLIKNKRLRLPKKLNEQDTVQEPQVLHNLRTRCGAQEIIDILFSLEPKKNDPKQEE